jgi:tripartite-type tricarboxylate transporter receptor subunit TctC
MRELPEIDRESTSGQQGGLGMKTTSIVDKNDVLPSTVSASRDKSQSNPPIRLRAVTNSLVKNSTKFPFLAASLAWVVLLPFSGSVSPAHSQADAYPSKVVTMLVPSAPGGTTDISARMTAEALSKSLGQQVIVENKAGANGSIATTATARAKPDGHTILMQYSGYHVITPHLLKQSWDPIKDFAPVANVLSAPQVIVARSSLPVKTLSDLVNYARANPGKVSYASSGNGSLQHVTGVMLEQLAGIKLLHVPYKGTGQALTDLLGGNVDLTFTTAPPLVGHLRSGKLIPLAVTGKSRLPNLPDVPTTAEAGFPKLEVDSWFAVYAPAGTPKPIIDKLSGEIAKIMQTDAFKHKAQEQGADATYMNPDQLADFTKLELSRWGEVIKSADIKAE